MPECRFGRRPPLVGTFQFDRKKRSAAGRGRSYTTTGDQAWMGKNFVT